MADKTDKKNPGKFAVSRDARLKAALKANLARRKRQRRLREEGAAAKENTPGYTGQDKDA